MSVKVFFPLFDWVVCFSGIELQELFVYFGELIFLSVVSLAIFFYNSEGCLFILHIFFLIMQKYLSLIRSHLFIFAFSSNILGGGS